MYSVCPISYIVTRVRAISWLLLVLLSVQTVVPMLAFSYIQMQIRRDMRRRIKAGVSENDLLHIAVPVQSEYVSKLTSRRVQANEFCYKGKMYDVVRSEKRGDTLYYSCIYDAAETILFIGLQRLLQDECKKGPKRRKLQREIRRVWDAQYLRAGELSVLRPGGRSALNTPDPVNPFNNVIEPQKPPPEIRI